MNRLTLARQATSAALKTRQRYGLGLARAISPYNLAERMGLAIRFTALPSLEGIYQAGPRPVILLSALRPSGRQAFTCAHEIGHHVFGHGTRVDEILDRDEEQVFEPEEYLAERFASALLMPKLAVESAFARRGWKASTPTPADVFVIAQDLGVGYATLIGHLHHTLHLISKDNANALRRPLLRKVRRELAGFEAAHDLYVVDRHWGERPVEVEVGDVVIVPHGARGQGSAVRAVTSPRAHLVAALPGVTTIVHDREHWSVPVFVARRDYEGLARYRHLEDPDHAG